MSYEATFIVLGAAVFLFFLSIHMDRKQSSADRLPGEGLRLPWKLLMFVCLLVIIAMAAHLISLFTGKPLQPTRRRGM